MKFWQNALLQRRRATPQAERVFAPAESIGALAFTVGIAQSLGRQSSDRALLEHCLALVHFVACVNPKLSWFHTTVVHACRKLAELKSENPEIGRDFDALLQVLRS